MANKDSKSLADRVVSGVKSFFSGETTKQALADKKGGTSEGKNTSQSNKTKPTTNDLVAKKQETADKNGVSLRDVRTTHESGKVGTVVTKKADTSKTDTSKTDTSKTNTSKTDTSKKDTSKTDTSKTDSEKDKTTTTTPNRITSIIDNIVGNGDNNALSYIENNTIPDIAKEVRVQAADYLPSSYQYDYDWMKDQITQDIDNANNYLSKYTDQLINRASDANADNLYNLLKTLRKNRASGITSDANTGYNAATDLASIIAANQAGNETLQSLANTGQDAAYNLYSRLADATNNANNNLNAWGNTQADYGSNVMGNYLYNALGSLLNMYGTKYNADSVANSAARELAETIANNNSYWNYVNKK